MTALNSEGLEKAWRFDIQYGPEGETNYAWVYNGKDLVATMRTHYAESVVEAMNRRALPPVDGLEVVALDLAKRIEREFYHDQAGGAVQTRAKVQVIIAEALSQASSVIAGLKEANEDLMRERTSLIDTKREQIERLTKERDEAVDNGHDWFNVSQDRMERISSLEEENKRLRDALGNAERSFNNIRGAIESNQVVDKDAHGTAIRARDAARQALEDHNG